MEKIKLDDSLIAAGCAYYRREFQRPKLRIYEQLQQKERSTVLPLESAAAYTALEQAFGISHAVRQVLPGIVTEPHQEKEAFTTAYALFCGASVSMQQLQVIGNPPKPYSGTVQFGQGNYATADMLLQHYLTSTAKERDVCSATKGYLEWLISETRNTLEQPLFALLLSELSGSAIVVKGITFQGISQRSEASIRYAGSLDDIVGNRAAKATLRRCLDYVLSYRPAEKRNVLKEEADFPQKILLHGREGTGKTSLLKALASYGQQHAEKERVAFQVLSISNAFKSEFYSVSARNLREQLRQVHQGDASHLILIEDIDTVFQSRDELKNRPEDKAILGELMNAVEGIASSDLGNYLLVATTNHPASQDSALLGRLREHELVATGPETPEDYVELFQRKLKLEKLPEEWISVGAFCAEYGLTGRAVRNIAVQLLDVSIGVLPDGWYARTSEEQQAFVRARKSAISAPEAFELAKRYAEFGKEGEHVLES